MKCKNLKSNWIYEFDEMKNKWEKGNELDETKNKWEKCNDFSLVMKINEKHTIMN